MNNASTPARPRSAPVLTRPERAASPRHAAQAAMGRSFQVLQSSRAPAQLCLFLRPSAIDVK
jgi:hypothetical protein